MRKYNLCTYKYEMNKQNRTLHCTQNDSKSHICCNSWLNAHCRNLFFFFQTIRFEFLTTHKKMGAYLRIFFVHKSISLFMRKCKWDYKIFEVFVCRSACAQKKTTTNHTYEKWIYKLCLNSSLTFRLTLLCDVCVSVRFVIVICTIHRYKYPMMFVTQC